MRVLLLVRDEADGRLQMRAVFVEIPVSAPRDERIVRMGEGDRQAPRPAGRVVVLARKLVEFLTG